MTILARATAIAGLALAIALSGAVIGEMCETFA
jgi:hypothetical protein